MRNYNPKKYQHLTLLWNWNYKVVLRYNNQQSNLQYLVKNYLKQSP